MNWTSAYQHCFNTHGDTHPYFDTDGFGDPVEIVEQDDMWELFEDDEENDLFWAEFAAQRPGRDGAEFEDPDALGRCDIDRAFDWSQFIDKYDISPTWLEEMKEAHPKVLEVGYASQSMVDSLALKQRQAYDLVVNQALQHIRHRADILTTPRPRQLLYHIDGRAGTGKSFTIHCISGQLQQQLLVNPVQCAALTGVAAHGINGRTLHSLFRLPVSVSKLDPLSSGTLRSLQATLRDCTTLIIDEKSMLSLSVLTFLDQRLCQIFPRIDMPFGGMDIGLWGDFFQLPPVKAKALYNDEALTNQYDILGQALYKLFDRTVELDLVMRQQGDDSEQQMFRDTLEGLRNNNVTQDHWRLLSTHVRGNLSAAEIATFNNALCIYGKKKDVI